MKIILASQSPRRREILKRIGVNFEVMPSQKEEVVTSTIPYEVVKELSSQKADDIKNKYFEINNKSLEDVIIIGADTIVSFEDKILGKPKDKKDAYNMLKLISGNVHQVYTGVSVIYIKANEELDKAKEISFYEETNVYVKALTDKDILEYIETGEPMDKAGSYAIQGIFGKYIDKYHGDYDNVVGLPANRLVKELKENFDVEI